MPDGWRAFNRPTASASSLRAHASVIIRHGRPCLFSREAASNASARSQIGPNVTAFKNPMPFDVAINHRLFAFTDMSISRFHASRNKNMRGAAHQKQTTL